MSFTGDIKKEILGHENAARHCLLAETAAYLSCLGNLGDGILSVVPENDQVSERIASLFFKLYGVKSFEITDETKRLEILHSVKMTEGIGDTVSAVLLKMSCCRRAALTAWFMCMGSISDPKKNYHCEFACRSEAQAQQIIELLSDFDVSAHSMIRKGRSVVYIKESESIAELLNIVGAHVALMDLENLRIEKELRNDVNRAVNCDTANARKLADASSRQIEDIRLLMDNGAFASLPDGLKEIASVRLENPYVSLEELGKLLDQPIGKSGVNHRLRKLSEAADKLRKGDS